METVAVITNGNYFASLILRPLLNSTDHRIACVVIVTGDYKGRSGFEALRALSKVTALPYLFYKIVTVVWFEVLQLLRLKAHSSLERRLLKRGVPTKIVREVNTPEVRDFLRQHSPDLLVSVSCPQRIKRDILTIANRASINIHSSLLPEYAGLAPYYWVLCYGENTTGVTIHYMTEKFDDGDILVQERVTIPPRVTVFALFEQLSRIGGRGLLRAVDLALRQEEGMKQDIGQRSYYSHPSIESYRRLRANGHRLWSLSDLMRAAFAGPFEGVGDAPKKDMPKTELVG